MVRAPDAFASVSARTATASGVSGGEAARGQSRRRGRFGAARAMICEQNKRAHPSRRRRGQHPDRPAPSVQCRASPLPCAPAAASRPSLAHSATSRAHLDSRRQHLTHKGESHVDGRRIVATAATRTALRFSPRLTPVPVYGHATARRARSRQQEPRAMPAHDAMTPWRVARSDRPDHEPHRACQRATPPVGSAWVVDDSRGPTSSFQARARSGPRLEAIEHRTCRKGRRPAPAPARSLASRDRARRE